MLPHVRGQRWWWNPWCEPELSATALAPAGAACACSYLVDNCTSLPLGLLGRLVASNDTILALVHLLDASPWSRTLKPGRMEKWIGNR